MALRHLLVLSVYLIYSELIVCDIDFTNSIRSPSWSRENATFLFDEGVWDSGSDSSFATAICNKTTDSPIIKCFMDHVAGRFREPQSVADKKCHFDLPASKDLQTKLVSIRQFKNPDIQVVLRWLEMKDDTVVNAKFTFINVTDCETITRSYVVNRRLDDPLFANEFIRTDYGYFLLVSSKAACNDYDKCLLRYMKFPNGVKTEEPPENFPFKLMDIRIDNMVADDFYMRGRDIDSKDYKYIQIRKLGMSELVTSESPFVSSCICVGRQFCDYKDPEGKTECIPYDECKKCVLCNTTQTSNNNIVNCLEFDGAEIKQNITQSYDSNEKLIGVKLDDKKNRIILVSEKPKGKIGMIKIEPGTNEEKKEYEFKLNCEDYKNAFTFDILDTATTQTLFYVCLRVDEIDDKMNYIILENKAVSDLN